MMTMGALTGVDIPAGGTVAFRQGGMHVMLFDIKAGALAAKKVTLTLGFADGHSLDVEAPIQAVGDTAGHDGMAGHEDDSAAEHDGH